MVKYWQASDLATREPVLVGENGTVVPCATDEPSVYYTDHEIWRHDRALMKKSYRR